MLNLEAWPKTMRLPVLATTLQNQTDTFCRQRPAGSATKEGTWRSCTAPGAPPADDRRPISDVRRNPNPDSCPARRCPASRGPIFEPAQMRTDPAICGSTAGSASTGTQMIGDQFIGA